MDVSIIIVNYKTATSVLDTIDSIYRTTSTLSFEVIVVDNASGEQDNRLLRNDSRLKLIELNTNKGFGYANNQAFHISQGRYIFCLNPDTILRNNAIEILANYLDTHAQVGIVGGNLFNAQGLPTHSYHRLWPGILSELDFACGQIIRKIRFGRNAQFNYTDRPISVAMITGADLMVRRELWQQVGGFDETFFMYNEDADLCWRIHQLGYQVVNIPTAHITHLEGQSSSDKLRRTQLTIQGRNTYFHKHYSARYCEWGNRLYRITNQLASYLCRIRGDHNSQALYQQRVDECRRQAPMLVNGRFLLRKPTGVEQYAINIVRAMADQGKEIQLICPRLGAISPSYNLQGLTLLRRGLSSGHLWEQVFLPLYRLFHHEGHFITFCGLGSILCHREIMTIHDLSFLANPQWFSKLYALTYRLLTPLAARSAKAILTVSHYSYNQIIQAYPFVKNKTYIISCAIPQSICTFHGESHANKGYLLSVASIDPRKNMAILLPVMQQHPEWQMKLVGSASHVFGTAFAEPVPNNVELMGYVDNNQLGQLYAEATAFVFPSLFEGFGIPPLEAMVMGCPVICSDIPVLREVLNDAPVYFQPQDSADLEKAIEQVLNFSNEERSKWIQHGKQQAGKYSWSNSAKQLTSILSKI